MSALPYILLFAACALLVLGLAGMYWCEHNAGMDAPDESEQRINAMFDEPQAIADRMLEANAPKPYTGPERRRFRSRRDAA